MKRLVILASLLVACGGAEHAPIYVEPVNVAGSTAAEAGQPNDVGSAGESPVTEGGDAGMGGTNSVAVGGQHAGGASTLGGAAGKMNTAGSGGDSTSTGGSASGGTVGMGGNGGVGGGTGGQSPMECDPIVRNMSDWHVTYVLFDGDLATCFDPETAVSPSVVLPGTQDIVAVDPQHPTDVDMSTVPNETCYGYLVAKMTTDKCELKFAYKWTVDCMNQPNVIQTIQIDSVADTSGTKITGTIHGHIDSKGCDATYSFVATR
jgi:hypothetical protein